MKQVKFYLSIGVANCSQEEIVEFEDSMTDEQQDWKNGLIDASWWQNETNESNQGIAITEPIIED